MIALAAAAVLLAAAAAPSLAGDVQVSKQRLPDGRHVLSHEVVIAAPALEIWNRISTAEGWKKWAVPVAWPVEPDMLEGSYDKAATPNDKTTIRQQILFVAPARAMVFRTVKVPDGFPDFATYAKVTSLFDLEPLAQGGTRVRLTGSGYADTDSGRQLLGFFEKGNRQSLERLRDSFERPSPTK